MFIATINLALGGVRWFGMASLLGCAAVAARATTVIPPSFEKLVNSSDYVIRAVVKSVHSEFLSPSDRTIVSYVELHVSEKIVGQPPDPVVLRVLGGRVGEVEMEIEGAPQFHVGDDNVLFIRGNGRLSYPLVALMHGVYPIMQDPETGREFVARSDTTPLHSTADVAQPIGKGAPAKERPQQVRTALAPAEFSEEIRHAVKPNNAPLREK